MFLVPYEQGRDFLSGNNVVRVRDMSSVQIITTNRDATTEREAIQKRSWAEIDKINRQSESVVFISTGRGYDPEDIAEAGVDVTATYIKGPPGHAQEILRSMPSDMAPTSNASIASRLLPWLATIAGGLVVAGAAKWLGWV